MCDSVNWHAFFGASFCVSNVKNLQKHTLFGVCHVCVNSSIVDEGVIVKQTSYMLRADLFHFDFTWLMQGFICYFQSQNIKKDHFHALKWFVTFSPSWGMSLHRHHVSLECILHVFEIHIPHACNPIDNFVSWGVMKHLITLRAGLHTHQAPWPWKSEALENYPKAKLWEIEIYFCNWWPSSLV